MALLTLDLNAENSNEIITGVSKASAVQKVSTQITLPGDGLSVPILGKASAAWNNRGERKHVSDVSSELRTISPYTLATIIPVHKDLIKDVPRLTQHIITAGTQALAEEFDKAVLFGPAPGENFATLAGADAVTVTDRSSFYEALTAAGAAGRSADSIVISTRLLNELNGATFDNGNVKFNVVVLSETTGTINGIPYASFDSTESIGVIGAFRKASNWGTVGGIEIEYLDQASTYFEDGSLQYAFGQSNMKGILVEARYGFQVVSEDDFVKFGAASGS